MNIAGADAEAHENMQGQPVKQKRLRIFLILLLLIAAAEAWISGIHQHLTFEAIKENREILLSYVDRNYAVSVLVFLCLYISTAFFIPGTLVLTVASGLLFGFIAGTCYAVAAASSGATLAFLTSRYLAGSWTQQRFGRQLEAFNREISRHGHHYLLAFRIVPVLPFFMVNYLAGLTNIPRWTFIWTTAAGMLPGALVSTYTGEQLGLVTSARDIFSPEVMTALVLLAVLVLLPPVMRHAKKLSL